MTCQDTPRIRQLLAELEDCQSDLAEAETADQAQCARENIYAIHHSLWLAGYQHGERRLSGERETDNA